MNNKTTALWRDLFYILASIAIAYVLGKTDSIGVLVYRFHLSPILASMVAGLFFTSVFTTAPAMVALAEIALHNSIWQTALFGGIGAVLGDVIIFRFVRDHVADDLFFLFNKIKHTTLITHIHQHINRYTFFRWLVPLVGALIIASPLPDELGIAILGLTKIKTRQMIPLTLAFNIIGIALIGIVARSVV